MLKWLNDNRTWLFEGVGVVVICGVVKLIWSFVRKPKSKVALFQNQKGGTGSVNIQGRDVQVGDITKSDQRKK
jgi:hypothetical protein